MEEASAAGDLELVRESFSSLLLSTERHISLKDRVLPGSMEVIERSASLAAEHGHITIFSFLLDQGAPFTKSLVDDAFWTNKTEFCQALKEHGWEPLPRKVPPRLVDPGQALTEEIWLPQPQKVPLNVVLRRKTTLRWVLEQGWDPNLYGEYELHPLTIAAQWHPPSVTKILLEHGVSSRGTMAMHMAAGQVADDPTRLEVLDLLILYDGNVNGMEPDPKGRKPPRQSRKWTTGRPLHHAVGSNSVEAVRYLLEKGASPWIPGWSGTSAIEVAERYNKEMAGMIRRMSPPEYSSLSFP